MFHGADFSSGIHEIGNAAKIASVASDADRLRRTIADLEATVERQALACQALWELLQEHLPVGEKDLLRKMEQVDLRDGVADGKMTKQVSTCGTCNRAVHSKRKRCLYCGGAKSALENPS